MLTVTSDPVTPHPSGKSVTSAYLGLPSNPCEDWFGGLPLNFTQLFSYFLSLPQSPTGVSSPLPIPTWAPSMPRVKDEPHKKAYPPRERLLFMASHCPPVRKARDRGLVPAHFLWAPSPRSGSPQSLWSDSFCVSSDMHCLLSSLILPFLTIIGPQILMSLPLRWSLPSDYNWGVRFLLVIISLDQNTSLLGGSEPALHLFVESMVLEGPRQGLPTTFPIASAIWACPGHMDSS